MLLVIYAGSNQLVKKRFSHLENELMLINLKRVDSTLQRELELLHVLNNDWAQWDDSYDYLLNRNTQYPLSNFTFETFVNLNIHAFVFFDIDFNHFDNFAFDNDTQSLTKLDEIFISEIKKALKKNKNQTQGILGLILINNKVYMISTKSILTSVAKGPSSGYIIMLRPFNHKVFSVLSTQTLLNVEILTQQQLTNDPFLMKMTVYPGSEYKITIDNNQQIIGLSHLDGLFGQQLKTVKVTAPRNLYKQAMLALKELMNLVIGCTMLFMIILLYALRLIILKRINRLSLNLKKIGLKQSNTERVQVEGNDEISQVEVSCNQMLAGLEKSFNQYKKDQIRQRLQNDSLMFLTKESNLFEGEVVDFCSTINKMVLKTCNVDVSSIWLFKKETHFFNCINIASLDESSNVEIYNMDKNKVGLLFNELSQTGYFRVNQLHVYPDYIQYLNELNFNLEQKSMMNVAIKFKGDLVGFISIVLKGNSQELRLDEDVFLLSSAELIEQTIAAKERIELEEKLWRLASFDNLTQLPNRNYFYKKAKIAIDHAKSEQHKMALLFIDLDRFKSVNDQYGHLVGDELLKQVAGRIKSVVRADDLVARIGGDEFVILLTKIGEHKHAEKVCKLLVNSLSIEFNIMGEVVNIGASIGIAVFPEHAENTDILMSLADSAMYQVKNKTGNGFVMYSPSQKNTKQ